MEETARGDQADPEAFWARVEKQKDAIRDPPVHGSSRQRRLVGRRERSVPRCSSSPCSSREWRSSTRSTPGSTSTPFARSPKPSRPCAADDLGVLLITHYSRILRYMNPDRIHVMVAGQIVRLADRELAEELEGTGYESFR